MLGGERSGLYHEFKNFFFKLGFPREITKHGTEGARRKSFEGYTLIYSHDLIAPRESLINLQKPAQTALRIPPKEARK
jgi:hypothetical protein